jgi:DNA-binding transcriptional MocR family regulator
VQVGDNLTPMRTANRNVPIYLKLAQSLEQQIQKGTFTVGDQVPSVRELSRQHRISVSTVLQAYFWLENKGWIEAKAKSGFYVRTPVQTLKPEPVYRAVQSKPIPVTMGELALEAMQSGLSARISLSAACPSPDRFPTHRLNSIIRRILRDNPAHSATYTIPPGSLALRQQIAKRSVSFGCHFLPQHVTITCGAMEALNLCLRAIGKPGDVIATESPTYFSVLQAIESLGMKAVEIPTHPRTGMDLGVLEQAITKHRVRGCIAMTNCHNPLGYILPDATKRALVDLLARHEVPLIEDDVYGDLAFSLRRSRTAKAFDRRGLVMVCGSFSKTISPGLRMGWVHSERYHSTIEQLKLITSITSPALSETVIAEFLESGGYDRHLRQMRIACEQQVRAFSRAISKYFPEGTRVSRPEGGYVLWLELPEGIDSVALFRAALQEGISTSPGPIFSASGKFRNCIRLNCGLKFSDEVDRAILKLGRLCDTPLLS